MKTKIFALFLCLATLLSMAIPVSAVVPGDGQQEVPGSLAITEICAVTPALPEGNIPNQLASKNKADLYEYIEVKNISNASLNLQDYTILRFGFSHSGKYAGSGLGQVLAWSNTAKFNIQPLTNITATTLAAGDIALLWMIPESSKNNYSISDFKAYWTARGNDMTNVTVIQVTHTAPASNINSNAGNNFLPDIYTGYNIALIKTSLCPASVTTDGGTVISWTDLVSGTEINGSGTNGLWLPKETGASLYEKCDSNALYYTTKTANENSHHYYSFVDINGLQAAMTAPVLSKLTLNNKTVSATTLNYATTVTGKLDDNGLPPTKVFANTSTAFDDSTRNANGYLTANDGDYATPTPGAAANQFTSSSDLLVIEKAQTKVEGDYQTIRFVGHIDSLNYEKVGIKIFATYNNGTAVVEKEIKTIDTDVVYKSIQAGDDTVTVESLTGKNDGYIIAIAVSGLPAVDSAATTFYVVPYGVTESGNTVFGDWATLKLSAFNPVEAE